MTIYGRTTSFCTECGTQAKGKDFCSAKCRSAFHNRRTRRGALVYDVMMIQLTSPEAFSQFNLASRLDAQLAIWRKEDEARGQKRTTALPRELNYALPHPALSVHHG